MKRKLPPEDVDEIKRLEKQIRELKAINRSLLRQLKKLSKGINKEEFDKAMDEMEASGFIKPQFKKEEKKLCEECGRGRISEVSIAGRLFQRCDVCDFRSRVINDKEKSKP